MLYIIYWGFMLIWVIGIIIFSRHDIGKIENTFAKMWGARLDTLGCLGVGVCYVHMYKDEWGLFRTLYIIVMVLIFIRNAMAEYKTRMIFNKQYRDEFEK